MSEKFSLQWNDFQSNVSNSFSLLRYEDSLHDVTIVTDDNEQTAGHKLVLSACSEYFKTIFKKNKHSHPLLCLEGVSSKDIRNVMDYIYNGEVQIFQEDLDRFLIVAQRLKLEGLLQQTDPYPRQEDEEVPSKNVLKQDAKSEKSQLKSYPVHENEIAKIISETHPDNISEIDEQIEQNIVKNLDGSLSCKICGKSSGKKLSNIKTHIETHFEGLSFNCPMCEKTCRSRHALATHKYLYHRSQK